MASFLATLLSLLLLGAPPGESGLVFIDPGHGGLNQGAVGPDGLEEKVLTLDISRRLDALLREAGLRTAMSRSDDRFVGLRERTRQANAADAALFLSIHVNSSPTPKPHGIDVYVLSEEVAREEGLEIVQREEGAAPSPHRKGLGAVLHGLHLAGSQRASVALAHRVLEGLVESTGALSRGVRHAPFAVLKEARMPALVIEVGFLSNPAEAADLARPEYRQRIAEGIAGSVRAWLGLRSGLGER